MVFRAYVEKKLEEGKDVILEIEIQGALKVKEKFPDMLLGAGTVITTGSVGAGFVPGLIAVAVIVAVVVILVVVVCVIVATSKKKNKKQNLLQGDFKPCEEVNF